MITTDRQTQAVISDDAIAERYSSETTRIATRPMTNETPVVRTGARGRPIEAVYASRMPPRDGSRPARAIIAMTITRKGTPSWSPSLGSQSQTVCSLISSDCSIPMPRPAATVMGNEVKRPTSAAPSAGTTNSV